MSRVYIALGSNLGNRSGQLEAAVRTMASALQVIRQSPVYETEPWGYSEQPKFLNQVVEAQTDLPPAELLHTLKAIERRLGRQPSFHYGPREIDLDILFYDDLQVQTEELTIPHPQLARRAFVLVPLADLAPDLRHPVLGKTVGELLGEVDSAGVARYLAGQNEELARRLLPWGTRTFVMGILNVTPDSFSGDGLLGRFDPLAAALEQAQQFLAGGADVLDLGGESTRPGAQPISAEEELARVVPVLRALRSAGINALISVDTYKASVAGAALDEGADWINDVWALRADPRMAAVVAAAHVPVVLMHNRSQPQSIELRERVGASYAGAHYANLIEDVNRELLQSVGLAFAAGIPQEAILLDPGLGFGKTLSQNLELIDRIGEIRALGYPVLIGPSRKSFIGRVLDSPAEERLEGTAAAVALGAARGADVVRVHDLPAMARVARMADAIARPAVRETLEKAKAGS